ncbi:hypothetical protein [Mycobacterium sp. UM_Kg27]|uniref:hypothetical protein n=1 Tax=Mycobacterium sp. UM_Kg27 TaxID=1545693 RepID=UPI000A5BDC0E|nr:hypothetical protein [Mycobacterium sp. UM_Kg27]
MAAEIGVGEQALGRWVRPAGEVSDADNNGVALNADERPERVLLSEENAELRSGGQLLKNPQLRRLRTERWKRTGSSKSRRSTRHRADDRRFHDVSGQVYGAPRSGLICRSE